MTYLHSTLRLAAQALLTVAAGVACNDLPVAPQRPLDAPGVPGARRFVVSPEVTVLDLGADAIAYGINDAGVVVGQSGELAAQWSPTGELRLIRAACPACPLCDQPCTSGSPNDAPSAAMDINNHGSVVGYYTYHERPTYAPIRGGFLWSEAGGFADIGWLDAAGRTANPQGTTAYAINDAGAIVGESPRSPATFPFEHAFLRSPGGVMQDLTPSISDWSRAFGINAAGDVAGFAVLPTSFGTGEQPIVWRASGGMLNLGTFGGPSGRAYAIDDGGVAVGTAMDASFDRAAFRWLSGSALQRIDAISSPLAINGDGYIAGEQSYMSNPPYYRHAVVRSPDGRVIDLGTLGGANSVAYAINSRGQLAGMSEDASGRPHAVRWDVHVATDAPPTANAGGPYRGVEGAAITLTGAVSDPAGEALTSSWNFGDGTSAPGATASHAYVDDGNYVATLTTTDPGGLAASATATVFVGNLPPSVTLEAQQPIVSGESFRLRGGFSDPGVNDAPWQYQATWGIGAPTSGSTSDQSSPLLLDSPRYCAPGGYDVRLTVIDKDKGVRSDVLRLTVTAKAVPVRVSPAVINVRSLGTLRVAVLSTSSFDARQLDASTMTLGSASEALVPVARHVDGSAFVSVEDVNGDRLPDLVVHFARRAIAASGLLGTPTAPLTVRALSTDACRAVVGTATIRVLRVPWF